MDSSRRLNIAKELCRKHADAVTRIAVKDAKEAGISTYTFGGLDFLSDKFATALLNAGVGLGDSVAVVLPPSAALVIAHLGALKASAVVVPFPLISSVASLEARLVATNAKAVVIAESVFRNVEALAQTLPALNSCFVVRDLRPPVTANDARDFWGEIDRASSRFEAVDTSADSPAYVLYVDVQGEITGVVHSHGSVAGQLGFELFTDEAGPVAWRAGDWSSPNVLLGQLYPSLWNGGSVVAHESDDHTFFIEPSRDVAGGN